MTSFRQIEANRRNARLSTGPVSDEGKQKSRQNAVRHGLTAETVIDALEDADDYAAFEIAVTADYDAQSAVERELVLRLASLLWRLRRATAIESGLFKIQAKIGFSSGAGDKLMTIARRSSTACTGMRSLRTVGCRSIETSLPPALNPIQSRQLINPTISHARSFACQICRPIRSTG